MSTCAQSQTGQDDDNGNGAGAEQNNAVAAAHAAAEAAAVAAAAGHGVDPTAVGNSGPAGGHFLNAQVSAAAAAARNPISNGPQRGMQVCYLVEVVYHCQFVNCNIWEIFYIHIF